MLDCPSIWKRCLLAVVLPAAMGMSLATAAGPNDDWRPPPPKQDGFDWIELKSGEWLKGKIKSMQNDKLEFDSEELDYREFKWEDIRTVRSPRMNGVRSEDGVQLSGSILVTTNRVNVIGATETNSFPRSSLLAITPTGKSEVNKWSAKVSAGASFRSGNVDEIEYNFHGTIKRRTPTTRLTLDYLGNFGKVNGEETENNSRLKGSFDYFLSRRLFLRVPDVEFYQDPLQNLDHRLTAGAGVGYTLFDKKWIDWDVTAGPAWQHTRFDSVAPGNELERDSLALVLGTRLEIELTKRLDLNFEYRGQLSGRESGDTMHHAVWELEFEIHKRLTLDLSFVWDRIAHPEADAGGTSPKPDDFRVITSFGFNY